MNNIEPIPLRLKLANYANINPEFLADLPTMEQQIRLDLDESYAKELLNIPLGFYAEPPTVAFYDDDFIKNTIRIVKLSELKRVKNLGELLFDKPIEAND